MRGSDEFGRSQNDKIIVALQLNYPLNLTISGKTTHCFYSETFQPRHKLKRHLRSLNPNEESSTGSHRNETTSVFFPLISRNWRPNHKRPSEKFLTALTWHLEFQCDSSRTAPAQPSRRGGRRPSGRLRRSWRTYRAASASATGISQVS